MSASTNAVGLVRYDAMCQAIAVCHSVDEVKEIRNKARALEVYAAQALNLEAERKAREIRIRAERRAGELLIEMKATGQRDPGGRGGHNGSHRKSVESGGSTQRSLADIGISKTQSSQWQALAEMPEQEFEAELAKPGRPTTEGVLASRNNGAVQPTSQTRTVTVQAWGWMMDVERLDLFDLDPCDLLSDATDPMRDDIFRLSPLIVEWVGRFINARH